MCRHTSYASPALDMSAGVAFSCRNTSACVMKCLSERICIGASPFFHAEYPRSCITSDDGMSKQHIVANCTSQHSLHIFDVPASWTLLCPGPVLWFEEDFTRIFLDMKTQKHSRSVSSPTRVVSQYIAHCTVVSTIRTSASPLALRVSQPTCSKL